MRVVKTVLVVKTQTGVEDEILPLVLELQETIEVTLMSLSELLDFFYLWKCVRVFVAKGISYIVQIEITVFYSER